VILVHSCHFRCWLARNAGLDEHAAVALFLLDSAGEVTG